MFKSNILCVIGRFTHYLCLIGPRNVTPWTPNVQIKYFMFDWSLYTQFELNRSWKRNSLQIIMFVYVCSKWSIVELKTRFKTCITRNDVNGVILFNLSYLMALMAYLRSQRAPNGWIKYFKFDWSIYRLFVLNTDWKRVSVLMMKFVNVCSTWSMVQIKSFFETWITRSDVNSGGWFTFLI
jgi:hypothetical protein